VHLSRATYDELRQVVHRLCGLVLGEDKAYLVRHRLGPLARVSGCKSFEELSERLRRPGSAALCDEVVEAITTGETSFFRDGHPFDAFRSRLLPELIERGRKKPVTGRPRVRLGSVGCSTGQEPYSLAMVVRDFLHSGRAAGLAEQDFRILATDVSARVLAVAAAGEYPRREVARGLAPGQLARYFTPRGRGFAVREEVRRLVEFRRVNLVKPLAGLGTFDGIFCRNVLIYFDEATRRRVSEQLAALLDDGGWLVLGAAENLYGISDRFETLAVGTTLVYRKRCGPS
jgi:chemotaxis protein methyltransferase CheR